MIFSDTTSKIKRCILKKQNIILTFIVAFFGLIPAGCMEYGSPTATYILKGTVRSSNSNQGIENIKVSHYGTAVFTDISGSFSISFPSEGDGKILEYKFQDIDTTTNGSFKDKDTLVSFEDVSFTGGHGKWDKGTGEKIVEILLDPK